MTTAGEGRPPIRSPLKFFLPVFALSVPFWLAGGMTDLQLMPGLSVSALMAFCPMAAALILVHRERARAGVTELLERSLDFRRIQRVRMLSSESAVVTGTYTLGRTDRPSEAPWAAFFVVTLQRLQGQWLVGTQASIPKSEP